MVNAVIIVDDDNGRSDRLRMALQATGIDVLVAENCYELANKIYRHKPVMLVFNPNLAWLDALQFVSELKNVDTLKRCGIVFVYDMIADSMLNDAKNLGVVCLQHPFRMADFLGVVDGFLEAIN